MATHNSSEGIIKIGSDTLGELRSYSISQTSGTIETTTLADAAKIHSENIKTVSRELVDLASENKTIARAQPTPQGLHHFCMAAEHGAKNPNLGNVIHGYGIKD